MPTKHEIIKANYGRAMNKMRARIRFIVRDLGWLRTANRGPLTPNEWAKAERLASEWFMESEHSPVHKALADMTHKELRLAITVMERLLRNHFKKVSQPNAKPA